MENNLPSESYRPEDEYPALGAEPIEAAEPSAPYTPDEPSPDAPAPAEPQEAEPSAIPPVQQPAYPPQGAVPYMGYPVYPPQGAPYPPMQQGIPYQQPPQGMPYPQQTPPYQPPQGMYYPPYPPYYPPYPQQPKQQPLNPQPQDFSGQTPTPPAQQTYPTSPYTAEPVVPDKKKPASTGTKAFLIILCALLLAMVAGFLIYIINASNKDVSKSKKAEDPFSLIEGGDDLFDTPGADEGLELKHSETEEEIKLVADDGATQKRDTDNPDSIGTPDKDAKGITLKDAPKDKDDDSKYTAKSSFNALADSVVTISCYDGKITDNVYDIVSSGSGTILSADGYIVTNAHVLNNSRTFAVNVTLNSGKKYQAKIVGYDTWTDLAVLKIDAKDLTPAAFADSEKVEVGDDVIAIGSPGGAKYQNSLTQGVISAVDREISVNKCVRYIQSDAAINPGSSGGPLCNLCGQVIGITTAKTTAQNYENMSFSIPSATVKDIVTDLIRYGYIPDRARIGFSGSEVSADDKLYYGIPSGVIVGEIAEDGALAGTGVKQYDVITAIDGEPVGSFQDIYNILSSHKAGDKVKLSIYRIEEEGFFEQQTEDPTIVAK